MNPVDEAEYVRNRTDNEVRYWQERNSAGVAGASPDAPDGAPATDAPGPAPEGEDGGGAGVPGARVVPRVGTADALPSYTAGEPPSWWERFVSGYKDQGNLSQNLMGMISDSAPYIDPAASEESGKPVYLTEDQMRERRVAYRKSQADLGSDPEGFSDISADILGRVAKEVVDPLALLTMGGGAIATAGKALLARSGINALLGGAYETAAGAVEQVSEEGEITDPGAVVQRGAIGAAAGPIFDAAIVGAGKGISHILAARGAGEVPEEVADGAVNEVLNVAEAVGTATGHTPEETVQAVFDQSAHLHSARIVTKEQVERNQRADAALMHAEEYRKWAEEEPITDVPGEGKVSLLPKKEGDEAVGVTEQTGKWQQDMFTANINFGFLETTDDVRATIIGVANSSDPQRLVKPWEETSREGEKLADILGVEKDALKETWQRLGRLDEEVHGARVLLLRASKYMQEAAKEYSGPNASPEEKARFLSQATEYVDIMQYVTGIISAPGRALNAQKIKVAMSEMDPERLSGMISQYGPDRVTELAKAMALATNAADISKIMHRGILDKFWSSATELWVNGILGGIKTMTVNLTGNALFTTWQIPERALAGISGMFRQGTGIGDPDDAVALGETFALMYGMVEGTKDAVNAGVRAFKSGVPEFGTTTKAELVKERAISSENLEISGAPGQFVDAVGATIRVPTRLMLTQDEFFKAMGRRMQSHALAYREAAKMGDASVIDKARMMRTLVDDPQFVEKISRDIEDFAHYIVFQKELGQVGQSVQSIINNQYTSIRVPALKFVVPFLRTPVNIFKAGVLERNPVFGAFSREVKAELAAGGARADLARAKLAGGTMMGMWFYTEAMNGNVTGAGPLEPQQRKAWLQSGRRPYSLRVQTGTDAQGSPTYEWRQYSRLEPVSYIAGMAADLVELQKFIEQDDTRRDGEISKAMAMMFAIVAQNTMDKSFLQGASDFFGVMDDPGRYSGAWVSNFASSFVPNQVRDVNRLNDEYMREARTTIDAIKAKIPGLAQELPVRRNVWGEPRVHDKGWLLGIRGYGLPITVSEESRTPIDNEIYRLAVDGVRDPDTGEVAVHRAALINPPTRYIDNVFLDEWQYDKFVRLQGMDTRMDYFGEGEVNQKEALNFLVDQDWYKNSPPYAQSMVIRNVHEDYVAQAKTTLLEEDAVLRSKIVNLKLSKAKAMMGMGKNLEAVQ